MPRDYFGISLPEPEKLHPKVWVYRSAIKDPEVLLEKLKNLPDWRQWWVFGEITDALGAKDSEWDDFPTPEQWSEHLAEVATSSRFPELTKEIENYFYAASANYVEELGISLDSWMHQAPSFAVYKEEGGVTDEMSMHYHTDWQPEKEEARGYKFRVTCTMYLNGDYDGGELAFLLRDDRNDDSNDIRFDYKPTAGDILIFPAIEPFYHGVKRLRKGNRYFIRNFWLEYFPGTPEWLAGEAEYGPEEWANMEKIREDQFRKSSRTVQ